MLRNSKDIAIFGGTFTDQHHHQHQHQHHQHGPLLNIHNAKTSAMIQLLASSSPGALHNSGERFDPPKCHPNTRTAVLQRLMDWCIGRAGLDLFILWLYGPAGAGKSAISQTFAERCFKTNNLLASFFFSRADPKRNNEKALVATLAYQVALRIPGFCTILESVIDKDPSIFHLDLETQFQTLILDPLLQLSRGGLFTSGALVPCLFLIDGLDECRGSEVQKSILNTISDALQHHRTAFPFKFFIASRPEHYLTAPFSDPFLSDLTFRIALDDTYMPSADIKLFLVERFEQIRMTHILRNHIPQTWPTEGIINMLVTKSSGQFIYAATVIRYVSSSRHNPLKRLNVILGLLPVRNDRPYAQLDALYLNILSGVDDVELALRIIGISLLTNKSAQLSVIQELERFALLDAGSVQLVLVDLASVVAADLTIRFLHASFSDFLFDPTRSHQFYINPSRIHGEIARLCIWHVNSFSVSGSAGEQSLNVLRTAFCALSYHLEQVRAADDYDSHREEVLNIRYIQSLPAVKRFDANVPYYYRIDDGTLIGDFLRFLKTSRFSNREELYLHHLGIHDQMMHNTLEKAAGNRGLAFWTVFMLESLSGRKPDEDYLQLMPMDGDTIQALRPSSNTRQAKRLGLNEWAGSCVINENYKKVLFEFLTDPSRAGPYTFDESTYYTRAAEFLIAFAIRPWDMAKTSIKSGTAQWVYIYDIFLPVLSKAGYSDELVTILGSSGLTFSLGKPVPKSRKHLQSMFQAVSGYLLKYTPASITPAGIRIIIDWRKWPRDNIKYHSTEPFDLLNTDTVYCVDNSINIEYSEHRIL